MRDGGRGGIGGEIKEEHEGCIGKQNDEVVDLESEGDYKEKAFLYV